MTALRKMLGDMNGSAATSLMRLIETQSKETLTRWAAAYAKEHYLLLIKEEPEIFHQMEQTISAVENFLNKEMMLKELKLHLAGARSAAKEFADSRTADPVSLAAARAGRALCIPSADMRALYVAAKLLPYPLALNLEQALMNLVSRRRDKRVP